MDLSLRLSALSLTGPAEPSLFGRAIFFQNPENSFRSFSPRNSNCDAGPDMPFVGTIPIEL